jgi:porin
MKPDYFAMTQARTLLRSCISICLLFLFITMLAQQPDNLAQKKGGFGSPDQVDRQLENDEAEKQSLFELGFLQPYFDFKSNLKERTGLGFGLDYSAGYFGASKSLGEKHAGAGMVRLYGSWDLIGKGAENTGAFIFKIEQRHKYGSVSLKDFGFQMGYVGMELPPFSDEGFRMTNFYWRQRFAGGRVSLVLGLLDVTDYADVYAMASPWMHFTNFAFSTGSQTMFVPNDVNLGIAVGGYITDNLYLIAGINDANSDPTRPFKSFETFFSEGQYFKSVEIGWVSSRSRHFFDNIHLLYWHSDGSEFQAALPGWGLNFSGTWFVQDKWMPFLRGGYAEDGGSLLQKSVTAGLGWYQAANSHLLGAAMGWGEVNETTWGEGLSDQLTMELFYRIQLSSRLAITPDLQFLINPALYPESTSIFLWGLRGRLSL